MKSSQLADRMLAIGLAEAEAIRNRALLLVRAEANLLQHAVDVFGSEQAAVRWLTSTTIPSLKGVSPIELLETPDGQDRVLSTLGAIDGGLCA